MDVNKPIKRVIIFGCGQAGSMAAKWLGPDCELISFTDNNSDRWESEFCSVRVCSPEDAVMLHPDMIWIAVLNTEVCALIEGQLRDLDYRGEILSVAAYRGIMDLRLAALRLAAEEIKLPDRSCYLFDTFEGFAKADIVKENEVFRIKSENRRLWRYQR